MPVGTSLMLLANVAVEGFGALATITFGLLVRASICFRVPEGDFLCPVHPPPFHSESLELRHAGWLPVMNTRLRLGRAQRLEGTLTVNPTLQ